MVPLLDLKRIHAPIESELENAALSVLSEARFIMGPEVAGLEQALCEYTGTNHAIACASGSDALLLALMALDLEPGDEVITTPYTFFSTVSSITRLGLKPVFADIDPVTFNITPEGVEAVLTPRTRAIVPVHLFGQMVDMEALGALAERKGIAIIEDAAQALGGKWKGRMAGSFGAVGCYSFFPSKNLGGLGDGGAMVTNDAGIAERLEILRLHGSKPKYHHKWVGINSRMDTLQAALLLVKLPYLDEYTEGRRKNAAYYCNALADLAGVFTLPIETPGAFHAYNQFVIRCRERDRLRQELTKAGIGNEVYYPIPLHLQECFEFLNVGEGTLPNAERAARESVALPVFGELTRGELDEVVSVLRNFAGTI